MRKIFSVLLCVLMFGNFPAFAEIPNLKISASYITHKLYKDINLKAETEATDNNTYDLIKISKNEIVLRSYLKEDYKAYIYEIKNNSLKNIEIIGINNFCNPQNIIETINNENSKLYLPKILIHPQFDSTKKCFHYFFLSSSGDKTKCKVDKIIDTASLDIVLSPIIIYCLATSFTPELLINGVLIVCSPLDYFSCKSADKKAKRETKNYLEKFPIQEIKPGRDLQFIVLVNKTSSKLSIKYKDLETNQEYQISY